MRYIFGRHRHWIERLFWSMVLISCIVSLLTIYQIKMVQWRNTPMTMLRETTPQHTSSLTAPALTICGLEYVIVSHFAKDMIDLTEYVEEMLEFEFPQFFKMQKNHDIHDSVLKVADILGMTEVLFDSKLNRSIKRTNSGERFIISDSILEKGYDALFSRYLLTIVFEAFCFRTFTFRGLCFSCNILPPSRIYKNNTV
ncbi:uncharacterized protein LOC120352451 [Nilaparvata lugens]|uniref:uncharacterized protein LOC120352451 n=1 Tax=Nilaparvata lugens TaxID=108931 RepID=UPI00193D22FE|nr:uncharacterized protein LOC120352451 [Nilaparvata lugens]